jgi:TIR domain
MTETSRAIFLSYASQDTIVAGRIGDALRDAGREVWFDQSELRGGDAWDQLIRRRIRECALFVAVVSAHTQTRLEGYFRLEWRLAVERTHLMADGKAFLLPIVIDAIDERQAARASCDTTTLSWQKDTYLAIVYDKLGRRADAQATLAQMQKAYGELAMVDPLRNEPRFKAVLAALKFPD